MIDRLSETPDTAAMFNYISKLTADTQAKDEAVAKARREAAAIKRRRTVAVTATSSQQRAARVRAIAGEASQAARPVSSEQRVLDIVTRRYGNQSVHTEAPRIAGVAAATASADDDGDDVADSEGDADGDDGGATPAAAPHNSLEVVAQDIVYSQCTKKATAQRLYARAAASSAAFPNSLSRAGPEGQELFVELMAMRAQANIGVPDVSDSVALDVLMRAQQLLRAQRHG